eukprot:SAG22_NODE_506_length_9643_cov_5.853206_13_plen_59_part_00
MVEVSRLLGTGALVAAPFQDPEALVERGHMICPAFMVSKKGSRFLGPGSVERHPYSYK